METASLKAIQQADEAKRNVDLEVARRVGAEAEAAAVKARAETAKQFGARLQAAEAALADTDAKRQAAEEADWNARKPKGFQKVPRRAWCGCCVRSSATRCRCSR